MSASKGSGIYANPAIWSNSLWQTLDDNHKRAQTVMASLPAGTRTVLDLGCGNGVFANLTEIGAHVYGVDLSMTALRHLKVPGCQASAEALPFPSGAFDAVVCMEMLEHIPYTNYEQTLSELARISKNAILITVPYQENLSHTQISCPYCGCLFHAYHHVRSFDYKDLCSLFDFDPNIKVEQILGICQADRKALPELWDFFRRRYHTGGANFPWYAACPQCGYQQPEISPGNETSPPKRGFLKRLPNFWPTTSHYLWWLAIYRKQQSSP